MFDVIPDIDAMSLFIWTWELFFFTACREVNV